MGIKPFDIMPAAAGAARALPDAGRRQFAARMAALGAGAAGLGSLRLARAAGSDIVLANFGGDALRATNSCYVEPFQKANPGVKVRIDGSGPTSGKVKAIVESGRISWDVVDRNFHGSLELGPQGLLEEMDYSIVDGSKVLPGYAGKWGLGSYTYANVLTWNTKAFGGRAPRTWADFWNVKDFPGKRTMRKHTDGVLEAALLADGVPKDKLYPLDLPRAFKKLRELKDHLIFWNSHTESYQLLRDREVTMGCLASSRAVPLKRDTKGEIDYTFNEGSFFVSGWAVLKGAPSGKKVFEFIASTQDPQRQVEFFKQMGCGPINPAANAMIPADLQETNPSNPKHLAVMVAADNDWYAKNSADALKRFFDEVLA
ncbi:ABC transporter substrate-binding protein [Pigmentiphaga soli]|uniref:ABC transporter substrate-binding protein n=1 Tax=Pigmentiphaga soli TaxID=1007095 RepID=A0ABP8GP57_9BURK